MSQQYRLRAGLENEFDVLPYSSQCSSVYFKNNFCFCCFEVNLRKRYTGCKNTFTGNPSLGLLDQDQVTLVYLTPKLLNTLISQHFQLYS